MTNLRLTIQKEFGPFATALALAVAAVYAQISRGTVTGTVLDSKGAAVTRARMTPTGVDTSVQLSTLTNETGIYRFDGELR
jgi:hypothetical protein